MSDHKTSLAAKVMQELSSDEPLSTLEIAERTGGKPNNVASALGYLAKKGSVERAGKVPRNGKVGCPVVLWVRRR